MLIHMYLLHTIQLSREYLGVRFIPDKNSDHLNNQIVLPHQLNARQQVTRKNGESDLVAMA